MPALEALRASIHSIEEMQSVVKTMKTLAAVNIRQYERAMASLAGYSHTVEMGLQILLRQRYFSTQGSSTTWLPPTVPPTQSHGLGAIVFGSDRGLCGAFNQQVATCVRQVLAAQSESTDRQLLAVVGTRLQPHLSNYSIARQLPVPRSASEIGEVVRELLLAIERWQQQQSIHRVLLFHNCPTGPATCQPQMLQLLPVDIAWLQNLARQPWPSAGLPAFTMNWQDLFSALVRQHLFITLFRAFAASLTSENASRLIAMQAAERNIQDRLAELNAQYRHQRQGAIDAELLDVMSGFEALT
ncbi:MAG: F0F1 ATP synthase subunit gamma [Cyanobacteria bacterium J06641_5]